MTSCVQHPMPSSGELVVVVSLSSRALRPHGSKMARNMILNRGVSTSLIAWRTWGGQHEDRLKAEVIEIGLKKRSACVFEVQGVGPGRRRCGKHRHAFSDVRMLAERVTAPSVGLPVRGDRRLFVRRPYTTSAPPPPCVCLLDRL